MAVVDFPVHEHYVGVEPFPLRPPRKHRVVVDTFTLSLLCNYNIGVMGVERLSTLVSGLARRGLFRGLFGDQLSDFCL